MAYLTFKANSTTISSTLTVDYYTSSSSLYYRVVGSTEWTIVAKGTAIPVDTTGIELKSNGLTTSSEHHFSMTGSISASGDITSLVNETGGDVALTSHQFQYTFYNCSVLTNPPKLPSTTIAAYCYNNMFNGCENLTECPDLPSTTLANYCYAYMFKNCSAITECCDLPATTTAPYCYNYMFDGCTSIQITPDLPASIINSYSYAYMFSNCSGLIYSGNLGPHIEGELNSWEIKEGGCKSMFYLDDSLEEVDKVVIIEAAKNSCLDMFNGCESLTTPPILKAETIGIGAYQRMFEGCIELNEVTGLNATKILEYGCKEMYKNCTSLSITPSINAKQVGVQGYNGMFSGCSALEVNTTSKGGSERIIVMPETIGEGALTDMFVGTKGDMSGTPVVNATYYVFINDEPALVTGTNIQTPNTIVETAITPEPPKPAEGDFLTFTAAEDNSSLTVAWNSVDSQPEYSTDGGIFWKECVTGEVISVASAGDTIKLRATNLITTEKKHFSIGGSFYASGSVTSLIDEKGDDTSVTLPNSCFADMFKDCVGLKSAPKVAAKQMTYNCCNRMFYGCTSITDISKIIQDCTTLASQCFCGMFQNCTGITTLPSTLLSYTTIQDGCYIYMFNGCTGITEIPAGFLPATTLEGDCYSGMFGGCSGLTQLPANFLPASEMAAGCYNEMFRGCTGITTIANNLLPSTSLEQGCYQGMFSGCTSLTTSCALPASTLFKDCYSGMFGNCTSLVYVPSFGFTKNGYVSESMDQMFEGCSSLEVYVNTSAPTGFVLWPMPSDAALSSFSTKPVRMLYGTIGTYASTSQQTLNRKQYTRYEPITL